MPSPPTELDPGRVLVVDAANTVGSRPDGWWRDRAGATRRLRDRLVTLPDEVVLVVEGKARDVEPVPGVAVEGTDGSGDDLIVEVVRRYRAHDRPVTVVTADRGLRARVVALGADTRGPGTLLADLDAR
jgi:hypothetical protein